MAHGKMQDILGLRTFGLLSWCTAEIMNMWGCRRPLCPRHSVGKVGLSRDRSHSSLDDSAAAATTSVSTEPGAPPVHLPLSRP